MKPKFMLKLEKLITQIRADEMMTVGEACSFMGVGPWQIQRYAPVIRDLAPDIRYDGKSFHTVVIPKYPLEDSTKEVKLEQFHPNNTHIHTHTSTS